MKRITCIFLMLMLILCLAPLTLAQESKILYQDNYENVEPGSRPAYGSDGWTGDTASGTDMQIGAIQETDSNRALYMETTGNGKGGTLAFLIYRSMTLRQGETHVFRTKFKTDDTNGYKRLFFRGSSSNQKVSLAEFSGGNQFLVLGEAMIRYEPGTWYDVEIRLNVDQKKVSVYINGTLRGSMQLLGYDLNSEFSLRCEINGETEAGIKTNVYLDNTFFGIGDAQPTFESTEQSGQEEMENTEDTKTESMKTMILCVGNPKVYLGGEISTFDETSAAIPRVIKGSTMLPLRALSNRLGASVSWDEAQSCATLQYGDNVSLICEGQKTITINEENVSFDTPAQIVDSILYIPSEMAERCFDKKIIVNDSGGIAIANKDAQVSDSEINNAIQKMVFNPPSPEQIMKDFQSNPNKSHPRLLFDGSRLEEIKQNVKEDKYCKDWYQNVKIKADTILQQPLTTYKFRDLGILLYVSRDVCDYVMYPAFVYLMEGDKKYAERAWREMENAINFPDWHPAHFLDTAEMTLGIALGYDWLYDYLNESQREQVRNAITELGLKAAESAYDGSATFGSEAGAEHNRKGWTRDYSNWSFVCNGGISAGALAIMDESNLEYCVEILSYAFASIQFPLSVFAPDGAWTEGIGYWDFGTRYMIYQLSAAMYTLGTDYGYTQVPGFSNTGYFPPYHTGPKGTFNFGDSGEGALNSPNFFWFSQRLQDPGLSQVRLNMMQQYGQAGGLLDILFYDADMIDGNVKLEKDNKFRGTETAMFSSSMGNSMANYIGLRGSNGSGSHTDLDMGSYVLDALGERWAVDLGTEDYGVPGYWFWPGRADYYRKRAEGHNTLVLNPDANMDQRAGVVGKIDVFQSGESGGYGIIDMTQAYLDKATSVRRGVGLYDDRTKFLVQDEVHCAEKTDVWWLMQTRADTVEIAEDGKSALLKKNDKRLLIKLISTCKDAAFFVGPAEPFPSSPKGEGQTVNTNVQRLAIKSPQVKDLNMQVVFIPYIEGETPDQTLPPFLTIDDMAEGKTIDVNTPTKAKVTSISINGVEIDNFDPGQFYYLCTYPKDCVVEAIGSGNITVMQSEGQLSNGNIASAKVQVSDPQEKLRDSVYTICFIKDSKLQASPPENSTKVSVYAVTASDVPEPANVPENTIDGDSTTKWAANESQWIQYDLGEIHPVNCVGTQWMNGNVRTQNYEVLLSEDGETWMNIYSGMSSGTSANMEYLWFDQQPARYVRLAVQGTSAGTWTSLMETEIYEVKN